MRFDDDGPGTSRNGGDDNFVVLPKLACQAFDQDLNFKDRDDFYSGLIQVAIERSDSQLPILQNQKNISESIRIDASLGDPKALLLAILMLETNDKDWGVSNEALLLAVHEGLTNDTGRVLEEAQGILNGQIALFHGMHRDSLNDLDANPESDLEILDKQIFKMVERLHPIRRVREFLENRKLSRVVDGFLNATVRLDEPIDETGNMRNLPNACKKRILNFLKDWIDSSPEDSCCTELLQLPRQQEVTDRIIWLCGSGTPEGKEAAMLIADLLPRCGLIRDNGEVSKNGKWLLTALHEYASLLIKEEALESRSLNTSDYPPSSS